MKWVCCLALTLLAGCGNDEPQKPPQNGAADRPPYFPQGKTEVSEVEMKDVHFRLQPNIILEIRRLRGRLIGKKEGWAAVFDDKNTFILDIDSAEIAITTASLTHLMNDHVFAYSNAPLRDIEISVEEGRIEQKAKLKKGITLPVEIEGTLEPTRQGKIRLRTTSVQTFDIPLGGLLGVFDVELSELINLRKARGVRAEENDLILDPEQMLPPPKIRGHISKISLQGNRIVQIFAPKEARPKVQLNPDSRASNYMYFQGGRLRFGKLTMLDADLQIVDKDPADPFDFFLDRYNDQLVAGYSKNTPDYGLVVFMPDYNELSKK